MPIYYLRSKKSIGPALTDRKQAAAAEAKSQSEAGICAYRAPHAKIVFGRQASDHTFRSRLSMPSEEA